MNETFETALYPYRRSADQDAERPVRRPIVIVGAGPVGLAAALDFAQRGIPVVVLDDNDNVNSGSRAICFAKRQLEIFDRLGCGDAVTEKGVVWNLGKVYFRGRMVFDFNLLPETGHKRPAFVNLQQYYLERFLVDRALQLAEDGRPIELRGRSKVVALQTEADHVVLDVETPEGIYKLEAEWLVACDGAKSPIRGMMGLDFVGRVFEDNFLIADVKMKDTSFVAERRFWFDPPFNPGQSALLHKQPDDVWRIDLQLGWNIDKARESRPENVLPRLRAFLGSDAKFELEWVSIYTFQCRRMAKFRHGRVLFAGDSAHQLSPFGARGANSGLQDADNLVWKLELVLQGRAPESLLDSYDVERVRAADENILASTRSTDFITPKSEMSRIFRDAVLDLSEHVAAMRPMVNSGRLSVPCTYESSLLNGADCDAMPERTCPGSPAVDAPTDAGWLLDRLGGRFCLMTIDTEAPEHLAVDQLEVERLKLSASCSDRAHLRDRYLGATTGAVYLIRPDQYIAARWERFDATAVQAALLKATGRAA